MTPDAREVARAREWLRTNPLDAMRSTEYGRAECLARYGAERYEAGLRRAAAIIAARRALSDGRKDYERACDLIAGDLLAEIGAKRAE